MASALDQLSDEERGFVRKKPPPRWIAPMLATLTRDHFSDAAWVYERKLDGIRCIVDRNGRTVRLMSRNRQRMNDTYPELVEACRAINGADFIVDDEIVAFDGAVTSFARLQQRSGVTNPQEARRSGIKVYLYLFDMLRLDGHDVTKLPLRSRKRLLRTTIDFHDPTRFTAHRNEHGERYYEEACRKRWEGLIAKKADSAYVHSRSCDWLKFKCIGRQEVVIGGFTDPQGSREGFGALLIGYDRNGSLRYAGKAGTGFDDELLKSLRSKFDQIERETPAFEKSASLPKRSHWVRPKLVAEVAFTEWTSDHRLRHPRFIALRHDKKPRNVVRERPKG